MPIYAADMSAAAESVAALTAVGVVATWALRTSKTAVSWARRRRHKELVTVLSTEVVTGPGWAATASDPEVSLEAGIAYAREAARSGQVAETVWEAVSAAQSRPEPYTLPLRNYLTALIGKTGQNPARDFALGVLTERVRQEEDGWPDQTGDPRGKRTAHGTGNGHLCLLDRKHLVEDAIYATTAAASPTAPG
jgi:hypothetical protein